MSDKHGILGMSRELQIAWLAGIMEGEGNFYKHSKKHGRENHSTGMKIGMTDEDVIRTVAEIMVVPRIRRFQVGTNKPVFEICLCGHRASALMREMLPFMHARRSDRIEELMHIQAHALSPSEVSRYTHRLKGHKTRERCPRTLSIWRSI